MLRGRSTQLGDFIRTELEQIAREWGEFATYTPAASGIAKSALLNVACGTILAPRASTPCWPTVEDDEQIRD
jgi:hypothetical protein